MVSWLPEPVDPQDTIYLADADLMVVYVNEQWKRFAAQNGGQALLASGWNGDLLASINPSERARWAAIYGALLGGSLPFYEEELPCDSPTERRLYRTRIVPHRDEAGAITHLSHHGAWVEAPHGPPPQSPLAEAYRSRALSIPREMGWVRTASAAQPLEELGGDLLWHRTAPDGTVDLVLADVMGHGQAAGSLALDLVRLLDELHDPRASISANLARLDRRLSEQLRTAGGLPRFATGLSLRFDPRAHQVALCSFAHTGPIFSKAGYVPVEGGVPIGLDFSAEGWAETRLDCAAHGPRFLIFTDGVHEQFDASGVSFGLSRLVDAFQSRTHLPLQEAVDSLCGVLRGYQGAALAKDDRLLVGVECSMP